MSGGGSARLLVWHRIPRSQQRGQSEFRVAKQWMFNVFWWTLHVIWCYFKRIVYGNRIWLRCLLGKPRWKDQVEKSVIVLSQNALNSRFQQLCWDHFGHPRESAAKGFMPVDHARSCNSFSHVGSMIHELGHLLGMSHEHKRPDAIGKIYLPPPLDEYRGPYLTIHWQNIPDYMRDQYSPDPRAYTGSGSQQDEDPSQGYSDYDYESIMHYSRQVDQGRAGASAQDVFSFCFFCLIFFGTHWTIDVGLDQSACSLFEFMCRTTSSPTTI